MFNKKSKRAVPYIILVILAVIFALPLLLSYNRERGPAGQQFFYLYYPIHLILIGVLRICIYGDISLLF